MNERIRLLAEQAGYFITFDPDGTLVRTTTPGADGDLALFAELIVKDCLSIVERRADWIDRENDDHDHKWTYGYEKAVNHCSMFIKHYFGVE